MPKSLAMCYGMTQIAAELGLSLDSIADSNIKNYILVLTEGRLAATVITDEIFLKVKPGAKINKVELTEECVLLVSVKAPAKEGKANLAVVRALADYFKIPKTRFALKAD